MKIKMVFAGDFCSKDPNNIEISDKLLEVLNSCEIKCVNFEAPLESGKLISPNNLKLIQSNSSPKRIKQLGFNLVSLANNHMFDYGEDGVLVTKNAFKDITTIGSGTWDEAYEVKFITVNGLKIGFFSGTSSDFASLKDKWTDKQSVGCAWINHMTVNRIITSAKAMCDYLIVLSHGGIEFMDVPLPEWRDRYRELIDLGADAVIGSHPHVPQGIEKYNGKPIFYSLGNFFFDKESNNKPLYWDNGILAVLEIEKDQVMFKSIPIVKKENILDVDSSIEYKTHLNYLSEILKDECLYIEKVNSDVLRLHGKYLNWLLSGLNASRVKFKIENIKLLIRAVVFPKENYKIALHQIREESTRWLITRALKLKSKTKL